MSDVPPFPSPSASDRRPPVAGPRARDAVFEDVEWPQAGPPVASPGDGAPSDGVPPFEPIASFEPVPLYAPEPEVAFVPNGDGFRIDFDEAPRAEGWSAPMAAPSASTALVPLTGAPPAPPRVPSPPPALPRAEARRSVRDKAQLLRRHKWAIVLSTLAGLLAATVYSLTATPTYEAYSILLVTPPPQQGTEATVSGGFASAPGREASQTLNQALILQQAPAIAEQTARALLERDDAQALSTVRAARAQFESPVTVSTLAEYLQLKVVTVQPAGEQVDAIRVQAQAADPHEAALIAALFTERYQELTRETNLGRVRETGELLDEQMARRQGELDEIESQLQRFLTRENAAGLDEQTRVAVSQIGTLQGQLDLARVTVRTQAARLAQLEADLASVRNRLSQSAEATAVASPAETTALDTQMADLERLIENVYTRNPDLRANPYAHPDLRQMLTRLDGLRAERRRVAGRQADAAVASGGLDLSSQGANGAQYIASLQQQISSVRADLEGARAQVSTLSARIGEEEGSLRAVPRRQISVAQLERRRAALVDALAGLQRERTTADVAASTELGITQLIRSVQVPRKPSGPNLPLNLGLGGALGFLFGLALAAVRYRTDARAHTPHDLADGGFAVVGTIPDLSAALREGRHPVGISSIHPALVTLTHPFGPDAEAFRHLHANLYAADSGTPEAGGAPHVILVSGPEIGTGKSLVAGNLAVAAAQAGRRVLLVDADLRKPSVADLLGLGDGPALGEGPSGSNLVYWSTAIPSLFAMTPRERAESPEQLWAPHVIGALLANLRTAFDLIVIDAPPALVAADATLLAPHADAALLVARAGRTDLDAMEQVATELTGVGLMRIGAVLNRFNPRQAVGFKSTAAVRQSAVRT